MRLKSRISLRRAAVLIAPASAPEENAGGAAWRGRLPSAQLGAVKRRPSSCCAGSAALPGLGPGWFAVGTTEQEVVHVVHVGTARANT